MAEVIMLIEGSAEVEGVIPQHELNALDSAEATNAMEGCMAFLIKEGLSEVKGAGIVKMDDGQLARVPYGIKIGSEGGIE